MSQVQWNAIVKMQANGTWTTAVRAIANFILLATLIVLSMSVAGCGTKNNAAPAKATGDNLTIPVKVALAHERNISVTKTYTGTLEGADQANIVAKISERIVGIQAHVGETVRAGQVMILLDKSGASSQYYQAEANFKNTEKTLQRMKSLYDEGAISLQSLDGAQTAHDVAKANFHAARSAVELTTPISGVVTALNVSIGDLAMPGAVLATIAKINQVKVIFNINETDIGNLGINQIVQVHSDSKPDVIMEGKIVQISSSADVRSRSFEAKALFPNTADTWFRPGMFCKVNVQIAPSKQTLAVPNASIQSDGLTSRVFVVRNGRSLQQPIQPGVTDNNFTEIIGGLAVGDSVITVGATTVRDSSFVKISMD
jgi:membrane fusion protein, multidrug efflux system